ncbi:uncharacterized protein PRCAT00005609001 [Priceomyces carsonii]|uniref:uncharacterized protein n=1 Tax=Priceomyces carsonii TaxID=28549 RepID=UPI002ED93D0D|nr:unnamed protein product [Priceomyces carsonii]
MVHLHQTFHDLRYKVDYKIVDLKQKYYSSKNNPNILQNTLRNKNIITLRTCANSQYMPKQGEFLALEPKKLLSVTEESSLIQLDSTEDLGGSDPTEIHNEYFHKEYRSSQTYNETELGLGYPRNSSTSCYCKCHQWNNDKEKENRWDTRECIGDPSQYLVDEIPREKWHNESHLIKNTTENAKLSESTLRSERTPHSMKLNSSDNSDYSDLDQIQKCLNDEERHIIFPNLMDLSTYSCQDSSFRREPSNIGSAFQTVVSKLNEIGSGKQAYAECRCSLCNVKEKKVWQVIFSELSLSAARASSGYSPKLDQVDKNTIPVYVAPLSTSSATPHKCILSNELSDKVSLDVHEHPEVSSAPFTFIKQITENTQNSKTTDSACHTEPCGKYSMNPNNYISDSSLPSSGENFI